MDSIEYCPDVHIDPMSNATMDQSCARLRTQLKTIFLCIVQSEPSLLYSPHGSKPDCRAFGARPLGGWLGEARADPSSRGGGSRQQSLSGKRLVECEAATLAVVARLQAL